MHTVRSPLVGELPMPGGRRTVDAVSAALWAPVGTLLAVGLNQPLGHWVHEPRPYTGRQHVEVLVSRSSDLPFPSDHVVMAGAVTVGVWLDDRRLGLLAAVAAVLMAFTRVVGSTAESTR